MVGLFYSQLTRDTMAKIYLCNMLAIIGKEKVGVRIGEENS